MVYCGCGTRANKGRWAAVVLLLLLAIASLAANIVLSKECMVCDHETTAGGGIRGGCRVPEFGETDWGRIEGCNEGAVIATFVLFLVSVILATASCCACCCASPPKEEHAYVAAYVPRPRVARPQQGAQHANQRTYGQPGQPQSARAEDGNGPLQPLLQPAA